MLFIVGVFICPNTPVSAIQRAVPKTITTTRNVTNRNTTPNVARTVSSRAATNRVATTNRAQSTTPPRARTVTNVSSRTIAPKATTTTTRHLTTRASSRNRVATQSTVIKAYAGDVDNDSSLVKMYIPESLRTLSNIKEYLKLSGNNGYIIFKLYNNSLPNLAKLFQSITTDTVTGVYNQENTSGTQIVDANGETVAPGIPKVIYLLTGQGSSQTPTPECPETCGMGSCNTSTGKCDCFDHAARGTNGKCTCDPGYHQSGNACVADTSGTDTNNLTFTTCNTNSDCTSGNCNYGVCVENNPLTFVYEDPTTHEREYIQPVFAIEVTPETETFGFSIAAAGTFFVWWGDNDNVKKVVHNSSNDSTWLQHLYDGDKKHTVYIGGRATGYNSNTKVLSFKGGTYGNSYNDKIAAIKGSLGALFPTLDQDEQPLFINIFAECTNLSSIPSGLFDGISGKPISYMFSGVFAGCTGLTGNIPSGLFAGISGTAPYLSFIMSSS